MRAHLVVCAAALCAAGVACSSAPPPSSPPAFTPSERVSRFDPDRAWTHLAAFADIGPRVMGSEGAARAREYIEGQLRALGLEVEEQNIRVEREGEEPVRLRNVAAVIPGASSDVLLLIAPYDTRPHETFRYAGVNAGGSGAAVLLEMARVLKAQPLPYRTWLVFLEGEAPSAPGAGPAPPSNFGSRALASKLVKMDALPRIRLAVVIDRVCDPDLHIARDLRSHRIYREAFWRAASRVGHRDAFSPQAPFETPVSSQEPLTEVGLQRVVTLVDTSYGGDEPPGVYADTEDDDIDHCAPESLGTVGTVSLEALEDITSQLARIDRFSHAPVEGARELSLESLGEEEPPAPAPAQAPEPATDVPQTGDEGAAPAVPDSGAGQAAESEAPPEAGTVPEKSAQ